MYLDIIAYVLYTAVLKNTFSLKQGVQLKDRENTAYQFLKFIYCADITESGLLTPSLGIMLLQLAQSLIPIRFPAIIRSVNLQ